MAGSEAENVREGSAARLPTGIQQLLLLGDNIGTVDLHPSIVMVESSRGREVGRRTYTVLLHDEEGGRALLPLILLSRPSMQEGSYNGPNPIKVSGS